MAHPILIVDVFAERRYEGNQLAVVLDAADFDTDEMQRIALETNYSETTFVIGGSAPAFDVRIFTPAGELPFAGHPTLGTAWVIREHVARDPSLTSLTLNLGVGPVSVTFEASEPAGELVWLLSPAAESGPQFEAADLAEVLGLDLADIDTKTPIQHFSSGIAAVFVPLVGLAALRRCRLNLDCWHSLLPGAAHVPVVYAFSRETIDPANDLCARVFFDAVGAREDPATGSATAFLGAYLLDHAYFGCSKLELQIEQGHEIGRPSLLRLRASDSGDARVVQVGGRVIQTIHGQLD